MRRTPHAVVVDHGREAYRRLLAAVTLDSQGDSAKRASAHRTFRDFSVAIFFILKARMCAQKSSLGVMSER